MPKLLGMNHIALEVDDIDEALAFWESIFGPLELRGRGRQMAFIDMGDQFIALARGRTQQPDEARHFGLVVDDKEATRQALTGIGADILPGRRLDFLDPDGNRVEIVQYDQIQFTKSAEVLRGMELELGKSDDALAELRAKGLAA